jgi:ribose/xylose/arabinose/galactoside ABC-type transport system permease subunit
MSSGAMLVAEEAPRGLLRGHMGGALRIVLRNPILPLLLIALPAFALLVPDYASTQNLSNLALQSSVLLVLVGGGSLVVISGNFDLSTEGTLAFTAVTAGSLMVMESPGAGIGLSPVLVLPGSIVVGALIGVLIGMLVEGLGVNPFVVTLGALLTLKGAAALPTSAQTIYGLPEAYTWIGQHDVAGVSLIVVVAVALYVLLGVFLRRSVYGRHLYAVGANKQAARENGISPLRVVVTAYAISGGCAAVAGWLAAARLDSAGAALGDGIIFTVFAALVIGGISLSGGRGNLWGAAGGVLLLGSIDNVLNLVALNPLYVSFVRGAVILLAVVLIVVRQRLALRLKIQEPAQ